MYSSKVITPDWWRVRICTYQLFSYFSLLAQVNVQGADGKVCFSCAFLQTCLYELRFKQQQLLCRKHHNVYILHKYYCTRRWSRDTKTSRGEKDTNKFIPGYRFFLLWHLFRFIDELLGLVTDQLLPRGYWEVYRPNEQGSINVLAA